MGDFDSFGKHRAKCGTGFVAIHVSEINFLCTSPGTVYESIPLTAKDSVFNANSQITIIITTMTTTSVS